MTTTNYYGSNLTSGSPVTISNTTDSTTTGTGAITTTGGLGISKAVNIGTTLTVGGGIFAGAASSTTLTNSSTSSSDTLYTFDHESSGTPAAGFGSTVLWALKDSTTASTNAADISTVWVVATHGSTTARQVHHVYDTSSREAFRIEASGTAPMIGFLGATASVRQTGDVGTALVTFGLMSGTPTFNASNLTGTLQAAQFPALTGDVTSSGGTLTTSISSTTVTGKVLTGFSASPNSAILATDTILAAFGKTQAQLNAALINPMTTLGDIIYENATPAAARLAGNTTTTKMFLSQTGTGSISAIPAWTALATGDIPWATPGTIGSTTPNTGAFTSISETLSSTVTSGSVVVNTLTGTLTPSGIATSEMDGWNSQITYSGTGNSPSASIVGNVVKTVMSGSGGVLGTAKGIFVTSGSTAGTVTNNYAIMVGPTTATGTVTNNYGLYIDTQSGSTLNYSIFTAGAGLVKIGDTTTASSTIAASVILAGGLAIGDNLYLANGLNTASTARFGSTSIAFAAYGANPGYGGSTTQVQSSASSGEANIGVYVNDGTNNRHAKLFVDNTNTSWGIGSSYSAAGGFSFKIFSAGTELASSTNTGGWTFPSTVNVVTGFQINGAATTGNVLRGNGTNFVSSTLAYSDLSGSGSTSITTVGTIGTGTWQGTLIGVQYGGTGANLSATGGSNQFVKQSSSGAAFTVGTIASADINTALTTPGPIGSTTPNTGAFTTITANTSITLTGGTAQLIGTQTSTLTSGSFQPIVTNTVANPASSSSAAYYGFYADVQSSASCAQNLTASNGGLVTGQFRVLHFGTGTLTEGRGLHTEVNLRAAAGNISVARGLYATISNLGTNTISTAQGIYVNSFTNSGGGTINNAYGIYVAAQTVATNNYAFYSAGAGIVDINDTTDASRPTSVSSINTTGGIAAVKSISAAQILVGPTQTTTFADTSGQLILARMNGNPTTTTDAIIGWRDSGYTGTALAAGSIVLYARNLSNAGVSIATGGTESVKIDFSGNTTFFSTTTSTTSANGAVVISGGLGVQSNLNVDGTMRLGTSAVPLISFGGPGYGGASALIQNGQTSGESNLVVYVNDGTNNRRAKFFVDNTNAVWGLGSSFSSGALTFKIYTGSTEQLSLTSTGILTLPASSGSHSISSSTASTATTTGALTIVGGLGVGGAVNAGASSTIYDSQTGTVSLQVKNTNSGTGAATSITVLNDSGTNGPALNSYSSTSTISIWGSTRANAAGLFSTGSTVTQLLIGSTNANVPIIFGITSSEVGKFTSGTLSTGHFDVYYTTASSSTTTGAVTIAGGLGVAGTINANIVNVSTGYQVAGAATTGNYLRGNGTNFVSSGIQSSDLTTALTTPPAIGGTTPAAGTFTTLNTSNTIAVGGTPNLGNVLSWIKITPITPSTFSTAATSNSVTLFSLPARGIIKGAIIKHSTAFSGTSVTSYTISIGVSGSNAKYATAFDVKQATGNTVFQYSDVTGCENMGAATNITATATCNVNLNFGSAAGSCDIWLLLSQAI